MNPPLVHEVAHFKWTGFGINENHDQEFYKMLNDAELGLGIAPTIHDLEGIEPNKIINPLGNNIFGNISKKITQPKPKPEKKKNTPQEGLRQVSQPIVASIGPNVVMTPVGSREVPVAYNQIGFFEGWIQI